MNKNILITGAAGFLGSHLCKEFVDAGHNVVGVDNMQTGRAINISDLMHRHNFTFMESDIIDLVEMNLIFDEIYNMACPASPPHYQKDPLHTMKTNVYGIFNIMELAKKCNAKVFQASTSEVYGDPVMHPQKENYWGNVNPNGIRSCYDEGKRAAESICMDYHREHGVKVKIGRIFNTYGPNMDPFDGRVVSNFITQAISNKAITVYGNGDQTRSFCYVSDLIRGIISFMRDSPEQFYGPVNLGNPVEFDVMDLAITIVKKTGSGSDIVFLDLPLDDPTKRKPDISLAKKMFNWEPNIDLEEGLVKTIEYFKSI